MWYSDRHLAYQMSVFYSLETSLPQHGRDPALAIYPHALRIKRVRSSTNFIVEDQTLFSEIDDDAPHSANPGASGAQHSKAAFNA
jgi:hypothetical protein